MKKTRPRCLNAHVRWLLAVSLATIPVIEGAAGAKVTDASYVGVVPAGNPATTSCAEGMVTLRMDDEDHMNYNQFIVNDVHHDMHNYSAGGVAHIDSPRGAGGNSAIKYCPRYIGSLPSLKYDYAVISASNRCPLNSYRFSRRMDKEDSSNHNRTEGDATPNINTASSGGYTKLFFCFVPRSDSGAQWDPVLDGSIIFAADSLYPQAPFRGWFFMDDEDDSNNNQNWSENAAYTTRMQTIITPGGNSLFKMVSFSPVVTEDLGDQLSCGQPTGSGSVQCTYQPYGGTDCTVINQTNAGTLFSAVKWFVCTW